MSAAIELSKAGLDVDLIDIDPDWRVYGAGITITSPTLRAFQHLGILDEVMAHAYTGDGIQICNVQGEPINLVHTPSVGGPDIPGCGGIMRPVLHQIISGRVKQLPILVRLGITVDSLANTPSSVDVTFSDGSQGSYDFLVGADGLFSRIRNLILPGAPHPEYQGQTCWRLATARPPDVKRRMFFLGGRVKVGLTPVSRDQMYMFLLQTTPRPPHLPDNELPDRLRNLLEGYGGQLQTIRENLGPGANIIMRPLEAFVLPKPWHVGRVLLIGDAAHPTTPQLASGAGMAVEDALVLGQEAARHADIGRIFEGFMNRRYERCRLVVNNSIEIGRREQRGAPPSEQTRLVEESLIALAEPI